MEFVAKRKREQDLEEQERKVSKAEPVPELPDEVERLIAAGEKQSERLIEVLRMSNEVSAEECERRMQEIRARGLGAEAIRRSAQTAVRRGNKPRQQTAAVTFLFQMKTAVINGEKLPAATSIFCKIPFS
jgi:hypothetical protein